MGIVVSIPVVVYVISTQVEEKWEARTLIRLAPTPTDLPALSTGNLTATDTEALLIQTEEVAKEAAKELGDPPSRATELVGQVRTEPYDAASGAQTDLLRLVAEAGSANRAAALANAYAEAVNTVRTQRAVAEINKSMARLEAQSGSVGDPVAEDELARQIQQLRATRAGLEDTTQVIQPAEPPEHPISPHPRRNTALAGVVALLLGLLAVMLRERLDRRLRDADELEPIFGAPLLSVIPRVAFPGARPALEGAREPFRREPFRTLASSLVYFNIDRPLGTVMIASPTKGDGKTTVATYLSIALANDGQDVVLVDCDLRRPQVAPRLGIEPPGGLEDVLTSRADLDDVLVEVNVGAGRLLVLACGTPPPNPARLIGSAAMNSLLLELTERADIVILDTPPILHVSDAVPLLERVSGIVVVARLDFTSRDAVARLHQVISSAKGDVLGTVVTGARSSGLYGYGYYDYGRPVPEESVAGKAVSQQSSTDAAPSKARRWGRVARDVGEPAADDRGARSLRGKPAVAAEPAVAADEGDDGAGASDETAERDAVPSKRSPTKPRSTSSR